MNIHMCYSYCFTNINVRLLLFYLADSAVSNEMVTVPEGKVTFGKPVDFPSYGWDNEYGQATMK